MISRALILYLCVATVIGSCSAQAIQPQTGVIVRRPGEPLRGPVGVPVPPQKPNLQPPLLASVQGTILLRRGSSLFLVHGGEKTAKLVLPDFYSASLSPEARQIVYSQKSGIHLLTLTADNNAGSDKLLEALPADSRVEHIGWSADGTLLAYELYGKSNTGIHVVSLATGQSRLAGYSLGSISFSADGKYLLGTAPRKGLVQYRLADGTSDVVYPTQYPPSFGAKFSAAGMLGVLMPVPSDDPGPSDDEPDCTGAQLQLEVLSGGVKSWVVPFPNGFDDAYDFDFSPDGQQVAIGFGTVGCDYPGDKGAIYLVSLKNGNARRVTPNDHIALRGHFSPDGKQLAYTDFTNGGSPTVYVVDLGSGKHSQLIVQDPFGDEEVLDWRAK